MARARTSDVPASAQAQKPATAAAFWALMARWGIPDAEALQLIGQPLSASGKRPWFALNPEQAGRLEMLREIDRHATDIYQDAGEWLRRPNQTTMFAGMPPIILMAQEGREGTEAVLRYLNKMTFSGSVKDKPGRR
jgi:uncharacterized protein (DUF2384 family)